jgi:hypothetical protein
MGDSEWTEGVITPFIITCLAPRLGCRPVRLETSGEKEKRTRADYVLMHEGNPLVYIEHENHRKDVYGELKKLFSAPDVSLKGVVTYGPQDELEDLQRDILWRVKEKNDKAEWMLIGGVYGEGRWMEAPDRWTAHVMTAKDNSPAKL